MDLDSKPLRWGVATAGAMGTATLVSGWQMAAVVGLAFLLGGIVHAAWGAWRKARDTE